MRLDEVLRLPNSGVVILIKGRGVLITYTSSMSACLGSLYSQFQGKEGIELRVESAGADIETLKLHTEYYRDRYSKLGFQSLQMVGRKSILYKVRARPGDAFKNVEVELVTARGDTKSVGRFKTTREARVFIETYYGTDNPFKLPVYAWNADTKAFMLGEQTKLLDIR